MNKSGAANSDCSGNAYARRDLGINSDARERRRQVKRQSSEPSYQTKHSHDDRKLPDWTGANRLGQTCPPDYLRSVKEKGRSRRQSTGSVRSVQENLEALTAKLPSVYLSSDSVSEAHEHGSVYMSSDSVSEAHEHGSVYLSSDSVSEAHEHGSVYLSSDSVPEASHEHDSDFVDSTSEIRDMKDTIDIQVQDDISAWCSGDEMAETCITGMVCLKDGRLILADQGNQLIKLFDSEFNLLTSAKLPNPPWGLALTADNKALVTIPDLEQYWQFRIKETELRKELAIETEA